MLIRKIKIRRLSRKLSNDIDLSIIGKNLLKLRKARNMSQVEMALVLGYSERQYRRLEKNGTNNISTVIKIADYFRLPFRSLFEELEIVVPEESFTCKTGV